MVVTNTTSNIKDTIYRNKHRILNNSIIDIHGIRTDNKFANKVDYDKIVGIISKYTNKNVHLFVNTTVKNADVVIIKINN